MLFVFKCNQWCFKAVFNRYPKWIIAQVVKRWSALWIQHNGLCLDRRKKISLFLNLIFFQWKQLSIEFFFIIFLALETCLVAVSIGNCTFCFWGEITCGSVDWHKLAYRHIISLTKKWKWEFIFFADGRPQVEEIWILDSFCTDTFLNVCSTCLWFAIQFFTNFYSRPDMDYRNGENLFLKPLKNSTRRGYTEWMRLAWTYRQF